MQWMSCSLKQRVATTARIVSFAVCVLPIVAATSRAQGTITTVAGGGGLSSGPAITSPIGQPTAVAIDQFGNLFFASDTLGVVYKVDTAGQLTIAAGAGVQGFSGDGGLATSARLSFPRGVALDAAGNLFIGDSGNGRVRRVEAATGIITTAAGGGSSFPGDGGPATSASLQSPCGVALDRTGNLFIADISFPRIRRVDASTGVITTVAGTGNVGFSGDGGPATDASLNLPFGVAVDGAGDIFIADSYNSRVRKVNANGTITTVAGGGSSFWGWRARYQRSDGPRIRRCCGRHGKSFYH